MKHPQHLNTLLGGMLCVSLLTACGGSPEATETTETTETTQDSSPTTEAVVPEVTIEDKEAASSQMNQDVEHFGMFLAETIEGKEISDQVFGDYDLTMVNIWATWCGPCVTEMPYLQEVYEQLPDNVNMVTFCADGDSQRDLAKEILTKSNAKFDTIMPSESVSINILSRVEAYPTTIFVDRNGSVASLTMGVPQGDITATYLDYVDQVLTALEEMGMIYE